MDIPPATPHWPTLAPPEPPPPPPAPEPRRRRTALTAAVVAVAVAAGGYGAGRLTDDGDGTSGPPIAATPVSTDTADPSSDEPVAAVAEALSPAVVQIETARGLGSGIIYDDDGHILTAAHVLEGAGDRVTVRLADGTAHEGTVLGADATTDVGVVRIDPDDVDGDLQPATLATGIDLEVGQLAVAIGSPFGLDQTVTAGIVSALDRPMQTANGAIAMIQTDAPINPGNSGGALADREGRVIGINDAIESSSGTNAGVGFAIPIEIAKAVADKIVAGDPVTFAYLGVSTQDAGAGVVGTGAIVAQVVDGGPAQDGGLQVGDTITAFDGSSVAGSLDLGAAVRSRQPGDRIDLTVERDDRTETVTVTLGSTGAA
jgi:putative serine protease PepD